MKHLSIVCFLLCAFCAKAQDDAYFPPLDGSEWETVDPATLGWCTEELDTLQAFLDDRNTKGFLILYKGRIAVEYYFDTFTEDSLWVWNSAGKTLTAFTVGIAQQEGFLDINDPASDYLGEGWTSCTPEQENAITIWHQLTMTSGLNDQVPDVFCTDPECLGFLEPPGERWAYHNGPYTLLTQVVAAATGQTWNQYVYDKVAGEIGMNGLYFPIGYNRIYISTPRDMARFGLLMLNNGNWDGNQLLTDQDYFEALTTPSQDLNESYGYLWWLNGQDSYMLPGIQFAFPGSLVPSAPDDMVAAIGKDSQLINLVPSEDICVIRMGSTPDDALVSISFNVDLWNLLSNLFCSEVAVAEKQAADAMAYPLPANQVVHLEGLPADVEWSCYTLTGRQVASGNGRQIDVSAFENGAYMVVTPQQRFRILVVH
jgi:CubicO group peptidase (beta-lactamase class C family)